MLMWAAGTADCFIQYSSWYHKFSFCMFEPRSVLWCCYVKTDEQLGFEKKKKKRIAAKASQEKGEEELSRENTTTALFLESGSLAPVFGPPLVWISCSFQLSCPTSPPSKSSWSTNNRWGVVCHWFLLCHTAASVCPQMGQRLLWQQANEGKDVNLDREKKKRAQKFGLVWQHKLADTHAIHSTCCLVDYEI